MAEEPFTRAEAAKMLQVFMDLHWATMAALLKMANDLEDEDRPRQEALAMIEAESRAEKFIDEFNERLAKANLQ